jgi:membrane protein implicated in regulation of membrane protease activity
MPRIDSSESKLLLVIIVGAFLVGLGLAVLGLYLVTLGGSGEATIDLLGQHLSSKNAGITSIFIGAVLIIFLVRPAYKVLMRPQTQHDSLIALLQTFQRGTGNATENVALLERIANSNNPNKRDYLVQASQVPSISFMEVDAINLALTDLEGGVPVSNLLKRCRDSELPKIQAMVPENPEPLYQRIVPTFKYDRYISRKDAPSYSKLNDFLSECLTHGRFTERALRLSRELESELRRTTAQQGNTPEAVAPVRQNELPRDKAIRLAQAGQFSDAMDSANEALLGNQSLTSDAKFVFALARCSAALGDLKTSIMALQVLSAKDNTVQHDPEFAFTVEFLKGHGLTSAHLGENAG